MTAETRYSTPKTLDFDMVLLETRPRVTVANDNHGGYVVARSIKGGASHVIDHVALGPRNMEVVVARCGTIVIGKTIRTAGTEPSCVRCCHRVIGG